MNLEREVSDLGNLFVAGLVAAVIAIWTWSRCNRLVASVFVAGFTLMVIGVGAAKMVSRNLFAEPWLAGAWHFSSGAPSGHAAVATAVYGCAAAIFLRVGKGGMALAGALGAILAIACVCVTRVTLGDHTPPDVLAGLAVGLVIVAVFTRALGVQVGGRRMPTGALALTMALVAVLALLSGVRISTEHFL